MNGLLEMKTRGAFVKSPDFNKKILVVDDESAILQTLRFNLERSGYTVVTASDGRTAIALAQREQPDLVILDIMLPCSTVSRRVRKSASSASCRSSC